MDANNSAATIPRIRMECYFFHRLSFCSYATLVFESSRAWLRYRRGGERERKWKQRVQFHSALELASICPIFPATYLLVTTKIIKPADSVGLFLLWTLLLKMLLFAARGNRGSPRSCRLCRDQWGQKPASRLEYHWRCPPSNPNLRGGRCLPCGACHQQ